MRPTKFTAVVFVLSLGLALTGNDSGIAAEAWPQRAVNLIVPIGSGSGPDVAARIYAERLAVRWKQPVVVENRAGAEGLIGVSPVAALHDDHTLLFSPAAPITVYPFTQEKITYDPNRDLVAISSAADSFGVIATTASVNVRSVSELVRVAGAQPGKLNWGSGGGAFPLLFAGFLKGAGLDVARISYRQQNSAIQDLAGGGWKGGVQGKTA